MKIFPWCGLSLGAKVCRTLEFLSVMSLITRFFHLVMRVVNLFWTSCHHVMNVWLSVKLCSRDRQFTYPVLGVASSLIIYTGYSYCVVVFRCVFKRGTNSRMPLHSEFAHTLVTSRPEDAFIDLIANSIFGATILSMAAKIAFCILSSTVSTKLFIFLSILPLKHLSKVFTVIAFLFIAVLTLEVPTVKSWSLVPSLTTTFSCLSLAVLPIIISWSKSSNWLRNVLFDCLFLRIETMFVLITEL